MDNQKIVIKFKTIDLLFPVLIVIIIWLVYAYEITNGLNFNKHGIFPRNLIGLKGILFSPFIHSGTSHLFNNSIPFLVLSIYLLVFYRDVAVKVFIYGTILSGFLTWVIARESYHIGLSGVIYLLFSFVFFSGIIKKNYRLVAISMIVIFLYGSMIWYIFPIKEGMSWEGHLSGFLIGLFLAFFYRKKGLQKESQKFTKNEFDLLFDENGNFIGNESKTTESSDE